MLRGMLATGEPIWRQMAPELRPDTSRIAQSLAIGRITASRLPIHPRLPMGMREDIEANIRESDIIELPGRITYTDGIAGRTTITERALMLPEASLKQFMYYHAAADGLMRLKRKQPGQYTRDERDRVTDVLVMFQDMGVVLGADSIVRLGFRKILMEGEYAIAEIEDPAVAEILNNLFPTAMEIVTEEVGFHGGKVRAFVEKLKQGIVGISPVEDHQTFALELFQTMRAMEYKHSGGWQELLIALGSGERTAVLNRLNPYTGNARGTAMLLVDLQTAYRADEQAIYRAYAQKN